MYIVKKYMNIYFRGFRNCNLLENLQVFSKFVSFFYLSVKIVLFVNIDIFLLDKEWWLEDRIWVLGYFFLF